MSKLSDGEETLAFQLNAAKIPFVREWQFCKRRWRFDFALQPLTLMVAIEVEGGKWTGGHSQGEAYDKECSKFNEAMHLGWKVYRVTPSMVNSGEALVTIEKALGKDL